MTDLQLKFFRDWQMAAMQINAVKTL